MRDNGVTGGRTTTVPEWSDDDAKDGARPKRAAGTLSTPLLAEQVLALDRPPIRVYSTGFPQLDAKLGGGIETRSLTALVARTGAGKTSFGLGLARRIYRAHQLPSVVYSTELDADEVAARVAAGELGQPTADVMTGRIARAVAQHAVTGLPIHIIGWDQVPRGAVTLDFIRASARAVGGLHGVPPLIVVDFLQQLAEDDARQVRAGVSAIAAGLRAIAQELDLPMVGICSTGRAFYRPSRDADEADDPISYLGAAKESGDVEFAAANVLFLDVASEHTNGSYAARVVVAKARRGEVGFVGARFDAPASDWSEDGTALGAMTGAARVARANEQKNTSDDEKVLETVRARGPLAWRSLRDLISMNRGRADRAKSRLLASGQVEETQESYSDSIGRKQVRSVIQVKSGGGR